MKLAESRTKKNNPNKISKLRTVEPNETQFCVGPTMALEFESMPGV